MATTPRGHSNQQMTTRPRPTEPALFVILMAGPTSGRAAMSDPLRGFSLGAPIYRGAGWEGVCPLPERKKLWPPVGFTGWTGEYPDDAQIAAWSADSFYQRGNLMLRLSPGQLAFDVDAHSGKTGAVTMQEGEQRHGPLPPTFRNSSICWAVSASTTRSPNATCTAPASPDSRRRAPWCRPSRCSSTTATCTA